VGIAGPDHISLKKEIIMNAFQPGDVVQLKSGGPKMTCIFLDEHGKWYCEWFVNDKKDGASFPPTALKQVEVNK
jgi:uncharacterized protein YodC (DUF2158 family)